MTRLAVVVPATNEPETLERCLAAIEAARDPGDEVVVVREPANAGPAATRNAGVAASTAKAVVFVDADVEVAPDALALVRSRLDADPELDAVFGAYDDQPAAADVVSTFRNLLHHHVHTTSPGPASTFWAGLGAIRREAFERVGGFDDGRYDRPSVEDVDLGMRLVAAGGRIELDPAIRGRHLKRWTLGSMVQTDVFARGVPWVGLLLRHRLGGGALNLGWRHRLSALAAVAIVVGAVGRRPRLLVTAALAFAAANRSFHTLLARRGPVHAVGGVLLHVVHHLTAVVSVPLGLLAHVRELLRRP
jgi:GT2 family glycosyltransferase